MNLFDRSAGRLTALSLAIVAALTAPLAQADTTTSVDDQYRLGMYQRETGHTYAAIETLETLLNANPTLNRARLELAVAYFRTLNYDKAKAEAERVLADPKTPEAVRLSVLSFLKQIELEQAADFGKPHKFEASVSASLLYDSNVNAGPDNALLGSSASGLLTLDPASLSKSDWGYTLQGSLNHSWQNPGPVRVGEATGKFGWNSSIGLYHKGYHTYDEHDLSVVTLATGPSLIIGRQWRGNLNLQLDQISLGGDTLGLYTSLSPSSTWRVGDGGELTLDGQWVRRDFDRNVDQGRDSTYRQLGLSYGKLVYRNQLAVQGGLRLFDESAEADRFSNHGTEVFGGGRLRAWEGGDVFARAAWRESRFAGAEPVFGVARRETEQRVELGVSHQFQTGWLEQWQTGATLTHVHNKANISLYRYDRNTMQFSVNRSY